MQIEVATAILFRDDRVFLQLRDDNPLIVNPGVWGFFGGHLEVGETPEVGLKREIKEEIGLKFVQATFFRTHSNARVKRYVFTVPFSGNLTELRLDEGQDWGWAERCDVVEGSVHSARLGERRPIAPWPREVLQEFFAAR